MATVLRADGLRVVIYVDDHQPAHVHVYGDGEAKIDLSVSGEARLVWVQGMNRGEVRRAMRLVTQRMVFLLARWGEIHG